MRPTFPPRRHYLLAMLGAAVLAAAGCSDTTDQSANNSAQPVAVETTTLQSEPVDITATYPARVVSFRTAEIRPQVSGIITERLFEEGETVDAGQLLYQIDPALYEAALASARSQLAVAEASAESARLLADRYARLIDIAGVSQQELDDAQAAAKEAEAQVQAAQAAVQEAQINLDYTRIHAPISGVIGRSIVTEGALVTAQQDATLTTIRQVSPVYIDIQQPVTDMFRMKGQAHNDKPAAALALEDGTAYQQSAVLQFAENQVNEGTGTVNVRALAENSDQLLIPGMYLRATVTLEHIPDGILAPHHSVILTPDGSSTAYVVTDDNTAEARSLELGPALGKYWLIRSGLDVGDQLVVQGQQRLSDGAPVRVDNPQPEQTDGTPNAAKE